MFSVFCLPTGGGGNALTGPASGGGSSRQDRSTLFPFPRQDMPRTGYTAGGTPLAVTQEDFLVEIFFRSKLLNRQKQMAQTAA